MKYRNFKFMEIIRVFISLFDKLRFPFDRQKCSLNFTTLDYQKKEVNFYYFNLNYSSNYINSSEWNLVAVKPTVTTYYLNDDWESSSFVIRVVIERFSGYYLNNVWRFIKFYLLYLLSVHRKG